MIDSWRGCDARSGNTRSGWQPLAGELLERWRAGLAYVGQEGNVFNDSVRSNLLADGVTADDAALWNALEIVGLAARVRAFAGALDESVGDRGSHLSGASASGCSGPRLAPKAVTGDPR